MAIRNIIFDLGGVFIDIHYQKTRDAFIEMGVKDFDHWFQQSYSNPLFVHLETGKIAPLDFYEAFRQETGLQASDQRIALAWNAMLGKFRPASIAILPMLKQQYKIFLLSNTNQIHYEAFMQQYEWQFGHSAFNGLFHTAYYSHQLQMRKPDVACYQQVMHLHQMEPSQTLFIDDTLKNIEGAKQAGMQTLHLTTNNVLENVLPSWLRQQ